ncbi:hypothetical protein EXIGLDRAFT_421118 [Exidia glandulosa HHB12029]|uniref:Uncharacterized protein n=1 Tax=Exidia glandulosa HHB12029 TaxID=1314781 RepID=A0A165KM39_EXIGL|nr:hypothetical protein EXIGLDRAFT_421118 [Exidia glandulosa HHB12029]
MCQFVPCSSVSLARFSRPDWIRFTLSTQLRRRPRRDAPTRGELHSSCIAIRKQASHLSAAMLCRPARCPVYSRLRHGARRRCRHRARTSGPALGSQSSPFWPYHRCPCAFIVFGPSMLLELFLRNLRWTVQFGLRMSAPMTESACREHFYAA